GLKNIMAMQIFAQMMSIEGDCWDEYPPSTLAARQVQNITPTRTMGQEESKFAMNGKIGEFFCRIWLRCRAGTTRFWKLIASKITKGTAQEIFSSQRAPSKHEIDEECVISKQKFPTYDLACAGPRNRFTIVSCAGMLIVHNCGYGSSGKMFKATAASGQYGPRVDMSIEVANQWVETYRSTNPSI